MEPHAGRREKRRAGACAWHPDERAILDCTRCHAAICPECVQTIGNRDLCIECARAHRRARRMAGIVSFTLFLVLGLMGFLVLNHLFQEKTEPDQLAILERQLAADPTNDTLRMQYMSQLATAQRWDDAISELQMVMERNPDNHLLVERMVRLCMHSKRHDDALAWLERLMRRDPESIRLLLTEGEIYRAMGQGADAENSFLRAYSLAPSNGEVALKLADLYLEDMRLHDAQAILVATLERIDQGRLRDMVVLKIAEVRKLLNQDLQE